MIHRLTRRPVRCLAFACMLALVGHQPAQASTVVPMDVAALADHAGQVIVGRVAAVRSYWTGDPKRIESEVTFERVDYLKGRLAESTDRFTLVVPGGEVGQTRMTLCCAPELRVGDRWMLFLLPEYHTHPVVGIFQGAFLIQKDADGVERVATRTHGRETPVAGIGEDGFVQFAASDTADAQEQLVAAHNMRLVATETRAATPISYADFVKQLTPVLSASKNFALTAPAGKPAIVPLRAVPLQPSRAEALRRAEKKPDDPAPPLRRSGEAKPIPADRQAPSAGQEVPQ